MKSGTNISEVDNPQWMVWYRKTATSKWFSVVSPKCTIEQLKFYISKWTECSPTAQTIISRYYDDRDVISANVGTNINSKAKWKDVNLTARSVIDMCIKDLIEQSEKNNSKRSVSA